MAEDQVLAVLVEPVQDLVVVENPMVAVVVVLDTMAG